MKTTQSDTNGGDKYEVTVIKTAKCDQSDDHVYSNEVDTRGERWFVWHGILFEEPNPTGSRPSDLFSTRELGHNVRYGNLYQVRVPG